MKHAGTKIALALFAIAHPSSVFAGQKVGLVPGFTFNPENSRIVLIQPSVKVGAQAIDGKREPNEEWTLQARANIATALQKAEPMLGSQLSVFDDSQATADAEVGAQYASLIHAVAQAAIRHQLTGEDRLPTKKRKKRFQWGVGSGLTTVPAFQNADYALIVGTHDDFGSAGRKVLQFIGFVAGLPVKTGEHTGYAGLVDLKTGELVWLKSDDEMGGDVRDPEGAAKRVGQLLARIPAKRQESIAMAAK